MVIGKTSGGFEFEIDPAVLDNMELVEAIAEVDTGSLMVLPKLITMLLGKDQKKKLYDSVRTKDGRVPTAVIIDTVKEIFDAMGAAGKKS